MTKQECIAHLNLMGFNVHHGTYGSFVAKAKPVKIMKYTFIVYPNAPKSAKAILYKGYFSKKESFTTYKDVLNHAKKLREQQ